MFLVGADIFCLVFETAGWLEGVILPAVGGNFLDPGPGDLV